MYTADMAIFHSKNDSEKEENSPGIHCAFHVESIKE
jgi:hypothetical protein